MSLAHRSFNLSVPYVRVAKHGSSNFADSLKDYQHPARHHGVTAL